MNNSIDQVTYPDLCVKNLKEDGFYLPYDEFTPETVSTLKCILKDAVFALITGSKTLPLDEVESLKEICEEESEKYRPIFQRNLKTGLEMAGFINGYCLRYADLCDTRRQKIGRGGHPADMIAALLALCDNPGVKGEKILEAIYVGYHMWAVIYEKMMAKRADLDGTTVIALTVPVVAGVLLDKEPEEIQNALNVSAMGGPVAVEVRSSKVVTNCKNGATAYAIARAFACWRISRFLNGTPTMFTGPKGWSKMVAPLDCEFKAFNNDDVFGQIQFKAYPCCNANQVATESASHIHAEIRDRLDHVSKIHIHVCEKDSTLAMRPGRPKYPRDHSSADHHIQYCTAVGLKYGTLGPVHYQERYLNDEVIRYLIDITEVSIYPDEERIKMGGEDGAGVLTVCMDDGTVYEEMLQRPCGLYVGLDEKTRIARMEETLNTKQKMIENSFQADLSKVVVIIENMQDHSGQELLDSILEALN